VIDVVRRAAHSAPSSPALDTPERVWSYAELYAGAERMARRLWPLGAQPGETVALVAHPDEWAVQAIHAVHRTGAVLAPLNPRLGAARMEEALDRLGPSVIVASGSAADEAGLNPSWVLRLDELPPADPDLPEERGEALYRLWTSGTGGEPKVVPIASVQLEASAAAVAKRLELAADDRWYASLSPAHIGGLALIHRAAFLASSLAAHGRFDAGEMDRLVEEGRLTHASLVPTQLLRFLDQHGDRPPPPGLRCLLIGGAATPPDLLARALQRGLPVALTYGMTEATSQVATAPPELVREDPGTVGHPLDGLELRIDSDGEIHVRGDTVVPSVADEEGWYATGDLGALDDLGRLRIMGRCSARIISGGVNVDPARVEEHLLTLDGVRGAVAVGLPDPEWGETVAAAVVLEEGADWSPESLMAAAGEGLGAAERPRRLIVADALPLNANGKVDRARVRQLFSPS